jgi:hypothetical protein
MNKEMKGWLEVPKGMRKPKIETFDDVKRFLKRLVLRDGEVVRIHFEGEDITFDNEMLVRLRFKGWI